MGTFYNAQMERSNLGRQKAMGNQMRGTHVTPAGPWNDGPGYSRPGGNVGGYTGPQYDYGRGPKGVQGGPVAGGMPVGSGGRPGGETFSTVGPAKPSPVVSQGRDRGRPGDYTKPVGSGGRPGGETFTPGPVAGGLPGGTLPSTPVAGGMPGGPRGGSQTVSPGVTGIAQDMGVATQPVMPTKPQRDPLVRPMYQNPVRPWMQRANQWAASGLPARDFFTTPFEPIDRTR